jgi:hypothetical protein
MNNSMKVSEDYNIKNNIKTQLQQQSMINKNGNKSVAPGQLMMQTQINSRATTLP